MLLFFKNGCCEFASQSKHKGFFNALSNSLLKSRALRSCANAQVYPGGPADRSGRINEGDMLTDVSDRLLCTTYVMVFSKETMRRDTQPVLSLCRSEIPITRRRLVGKRRYDHVLLWPS
jgi:hypothetical protein